MAAPRRLALLLSCLAIASCGGGGSSSHLLLRPGWYSDQPEGRPMWVITLAAAPGGKYTGAEFLVYQDGRTDDEVAFTASSSAGIVTLAEPNGVASIADPARDGRSFYLPDCPNNPQMSDLGCTFTWRHS